ncbi:hypothetical protein PYS47_03410 [Alicyclobacillus fastidiosus]|nr:hypothetical protein [Alicyclobacillus fastidiosus]WEH10292.1 hypothetical protein PYS47_03410 [Alicyclobacillus fastidiosus]
MARKKGSISGLYGIMKRNNNTWITSLKKGFILQNQVYFEAVLRATVLSDTYIVLTISQGFVASGSTMNISNCLKTRDGNP